MAEEGALASSGCSLEGLTAARVGADAEKPGRADAADGGGPGTAASERGRLVSREPRRTPTPRHPSAEDGHLCQRRDGHAHPQIRVTRDCSAPAGTGR